MVKAPFFDRNGVKKGAWSQEEDNKLRAYVERYGHWNWRELPKYAGLSRCGKSCRLRWINYLRPGVKHGNFSREEENLIIKLHEQFGNKWSMIAVELPGRTDNEIKNYWHTHLKKLPKRTQINKSMEEESSKIISNNDTNPKVENSLSHQILESCPFSPQSSSSEMSHLTSDSSIFTMSSISTNANWLLENTFTPLETFENTSNIDDFWTQPFVPDQDCYRPPVLDDGFMSSYITCYEDSVDMFY